MITEGSEKFDSHAPVRRGVHRFLSRYFSKLRGIVGGSILALWLFGSMALSFAAHGVIRILGFLLLISFVAVYVFLAYGGPDDHDEKA